MGLFGRTGHGGGIIKRKLLLSVLLLFGLALVLNVNSASAANVTTDHIKPKITAVNPANNTVTLYSKPIKVTFSESIKSGNKAISLTNAGKVKGTKISISGKTLTITPTTPLIKGATYKLIIHSGAVTDMSGNGGSLYTSSFTVSPITLAQMKGGISRVQKFYNTNKRLPSYVSFGTKKIPIKQFQKIIASQGLKITTHTTSAVSKAGTVSAYGWNSCSKGWYKTGGTFINYCPFCHSYGCLSYNPKHTYEGEWTCTHCDSDFCNCGRCKASGSQVYLIKAV
jgi:methionine-rich copper-binding protein CopC